MDAFEQQYAFESGYPESYMTPCYWQVMPDQQPATEPYSDSYDMAPNYQPMEYQEEQWSHDDIYDNRVDPVHRNQANFESWYEEDPDWLFSCICPADLCDMPCPWDELGGCEMLRLCQVRSKYPHPIYGNRPLCDQLTRLLCDGVHDIIEPTCRSLGKQVSDPGSGTWQFCDYQPCEFTANLAASDLKDPGLFCTWGHDNEAARIVALWTYRVHILHAREAGARGVVQRREDLNIWEPLKPDIGTLHDLRVLNDGTVEGLTFHDQKVVLPWELYQKFLIRHTRRLAVFGIDTDEGTLKGSEVQNGDAQEQPETFELLRRAISCPDMTTIYTSRLKSRQSSFSI